MTTIVNEVRKGFYLDSVALMRLSAEIAAMGGIEEAVLMIGTPSNLQIMRDAKVLNETGENAKPNDLVIALRADGKGSANRALAHANKSLEGSTVRAKQAESKARTLRGGIDLHPQANLALISTPGSYAAREARSALEAGLNVMIFSDNVSLQDEASLKQQARANDLIVMGPDCGTAYIDGTPLAFANSLSHVTAAASTAVIAASGTGLQEFAVLLSRLGGNLKHGIGVGGRDLSDAVGGISTLTAIELLSADESVEQIVLISKPPGAATATVVFDALASCGKKTIACVFGYRPSDIPANIQFAASLRDAAEYAADSKFIEQDLAPLARELTAKTGRGRQLICGLYSGGTLCTEAQLVLQQAQLPTASNAPAGNSAGVDQADNKHLIIDLGADEYTVGRPHPMMEPLVRVEALKAALTDPTVAVVLLDVVLGYGAHENPAQAIVNTLNEFYADSSDDNRPVVIASVCGTESDPQGLQAQRNALADAAVMVCNSNCSAAELAAAVVELVSTAES